VICDHALEAVVEIYAWTPTDCISDRSDIGNRIRDIVQAPVSSTDNRFINLGNPANSFGYLRNRE